MDWESIGMLSRRQRAQEKFLMDQEVVKVSIEAKERKLDRNGICRRSIELEERGFFKKGKKHRDECNKKAT